MKFENVAVNKVFFLWISWHTVIYKSKNCNLGMLPQKDRNLKILPYLPEVVKKKFH